MNSIATIDYYILVFYIVLILGIGIYFSKFMKNARDYFTGGNLIPWWVSSISLYMSSFSAWTFTGASGFIYHTGWFGILYFLSWSVSFYIGYRFTAAKWRRSRVMSPVEYSSTRYNVTTQQLVAYIMVLSGILTRGLTLLAVSKIIASVMGFNLDWVILISGVVILVYTLLGGLWAVTITDVIQFIILLVITIIIMPMSIMAVGGMSTFAAKLPPLRMEYLYSGVKYNIHYLIGISLFNIVNANWGAAQRYFSVKDEKSAEKVGKSVSLLFLTVPLLFGIPPLAAAMIWPDLSTVEFFKGTFKPEDLVYVGMVLKLIPSGLIGFFIAAMFAATMSTIDTGYNIDSSIISRDLYGGFFNKKATDKQILNVGKLSTVVLGAITIITAFIYAKSELGIFNLMTIFVSLFYVPMALPMACGLVFKSLPRWSAISAISNGLLISFISRFIMGWSIGIHIYAALFTTLFVLVASEPLRKLYLKNKSMVSVVLIFWTGVQFGFFYLASSNQVRGSALVFFIISAFIFCASMLFFTRLFSKETAEERMIVEKFFLKLATPIDVMKEVYDSNKKAISAYRVVGVITLLIGASMFILALTGVSSDGTFITLGMSFALLIIGFIMFCFSRNSSN